MLDEARFVEIVEASRRWLARHELDDVHPKAVVILAYALVPYERSIEEFHPSDRLVERKDVFGEELYISADCDQMSNDVYEFLSRRREDIGEDRKRLDLRTRALIEVIREVSRVWTEHEPIAGGREWIGDVTDAPLPPLSRRRWPIRAARAVAIVNFCTSIGIGLSLLVGLIGLAFAGVIVYAIAMCWLTGFGIVARSSHIFWPAVTAGLVTLSARPLASLDVTLGGGVVLMGSLIWLVPAQLISVDKFPVAYPWECGRCGYLLFHLEGEVCPECGERTRYPQIARFLSK